MVSIGFDQSLSKVLCMTIDFWKTPRIYKKKQVNMRINISTRQRFKQQWSQHLKDVPERVQ